MRQVRDHVHYLDLEIDEINVMSSDGALSMEALPKSILIVGGGVIGIEWASMLNDFGVEVTVIEYADRIIPTEDDRYFKRNEKASHKKRNYICDRCKSSSGNTS